jgi:aryl-alcohol dehydrogenase-like predicted oxidoreductase
VLDAAQDNGIDFIDTAPFYGQGGSEAVVGRWLRARCVKPVVATKAGLSPTVALRMASLAKPLLRACFTGPERSSSGAMFDQGIRTGEARSKVSRWLRKRVQQFIWGNGVLRYDARSIVRSVHASLRRLQIDRIDLLLLHTTPLEAQCPAALDALRDLQERGLILHLGACIHSSSDLDIWAVQHFRESIAVIQAPTSVFGGLGGASAPAALIAREPFGGGRLFPGGRQQEPEDAVVRARLQAVARRFEVPIEALALGFAASRPGVTSVLAGMSSALHVASNARAFRLAQAAPQAIAAVEDLLRADTRSAAETCK